MTAILMRFIPGQKALAMVLTPAMIFVDHALHLGISDLKVTAAAGVCAAYIVAHFWRGNSNA